MSWEEEKQYIGARLTGVQALVWARELNTCNNNRKSFYVAKHLKHDGGWIVLKKSDGKEEVMQKADFTAFLASLPTIPPWSPCL